jgi:hypothetical protein
MTYHYKLKHGAIGSIRAESEADALDRLRRVWGDELRMVVRVWTDSSVVLDRTMLAREVS